MGASYLRFILETLKCKSVENRDKSDKAGTHSEIRLMKLISEIFVT